MVTDEIRVKMAEQLDVVVERARETFVDLLEKSATKGVIGIGPLGERDERFIERLFAEVAYGYLLAEAAAIVSFLVYTELCDDGILNRIVPALMDRCAQKAGEVPESVAEKTCGLVELARDTLNSGEEKSEIVRSLLQDIASMSPTRPMRATFDAVALSLLGE